MERESTAGDHKCCKDLDFAIPVDSWSRSAIVQQPFLDVPGFPQVQKIRFTPFGVAYESLNESWIPPQVGKLGEGNLSSGNST